MQQQGLNYTILQIFEQVCSNLMVVPAKFTLQYCFVRSIACDQRKGYSAVIGKERNKGDVVVWASIQ